MDNPATHVFAITELRELIVDEIALELDKHTLATLARVNTLLHDACIRRLWNGHIVSGYYASGKQDPSIFPHLLALLPEGVWWAGERQSFITEPAEADWQRFKHYSKHVTRLIIRAQDYAHTVWGAFSSRCSNLFPCLKDLHIYRLSLKDMTNMPWLPFITPSTESLCISTTDISHLATPTREITANTLSLFCRHLVEHAPNLSELIVDDFRGLFMLSQASLTLSFVIPLLSNLRVFEWYTVEVFPLELIEGLAEHPFLTDLYLGSGTRQLSIAPAQSPCWFPSLHRLHLLGNSSFIISLVNNLSHPELLADISFEFDDELTSLNTFYPLFSACSASLKAVVLDLGPVVMSWSEFEPLLACKGMIRFRVECGSLIEGFNDNALHELASEWRDLEELEITPWPLNNEVVHQLTWISLVSLAQLCTQLRSIRLNFSTRTRLREHHGDTAHLPQPPPTPLLHPTELRNNPAPYFRVLRQHFPQSNLRTFDACFSEINRGDGNDREDFLGPAEMSRVLQTLWPTFDLTTLTCSWAQSDGETGDAMREQWMRVQNYSLPARNGDAAGYR